MLELAKKIDHRNYYLDRNNDDKVSKIDIQVMLTNSMNHWMKWLMGRDVDEYDDDDVLMQMWLSN